jgi:predicted O-methyltransferase YrrM
VAYTYEAEGWQSYLMDWYDPHRVLEPLEREVAVVDEALQALVERGVLSRNSYDRSKMQAHRDAVREKFDIPWTAITPRMQRLLYAINAIAEPQVMVAIGIFCGNTFISNAGAAVGPGACYTARRVVGIEIRPQEAERARRNVATIDPDGQAEVLADDGLRWLRTLEDRLDLLYLDADGPGDSGKSIYLDLIEAAERALAPGSLVLAHNSVNAAEQMADYLAYVRSPAHFRESVNMVIDDQGLEVSLR